jgi:predicted NAD/FAD-binding protein
MRIAVVGSGVSGLVAAHRLHPQHDVTLFEADTRLGGHANTVEVDLPEGRFPVDTGFIVCNVPTYPNFLALLDELGVPTQPSEMSFAVTVEARGKRSGGTRFGSTGAMGLGSGDLEYRATNLSTLFAQRTNLLRPRFHRMLVDIVRFNRALRRLVAHPDGDEVRSLADFVAAGRYSRAFVDWFLVPFGSAIWSADPATFLRFPVAAYARFVTNHGMTDLRRTPQWRTVTGGSIRYVDAIGARLGDRVRLAQPVRKLVRDPATSEVEVLTDRGSERFDHVVLATHSDQALELLGDATDAEREILGALAYRPNTATLHTDDRFLPATVGARASWNFHVGAGDGRAPTLTYWMNRLQSIPSATPVLVTLNRDDEIDPDKVIQRFRYHHPVFDAEALAAQRRRPEIQGGGGIWFCGAYWGSGFHEDGVKSALDVVQALGDVQ